MYCSGGTIWGRMAPPAGCRKASTVEMSSVKISSSAAVGRPVASRSRIYPTSSPRSRSVTTMARRLGRRSIQTPVRGCNSTVGSRLAAKTRALKAALSVSV